MKTYLTIGVIAASVFLLFRSKSAQAALGFANLPDNSLVYARDGSVYMVAPRPATSFDLAMSDGTINLANSTQIIRPATALDRIMGYPA